MSVQGGFAWAIASSATSLISRKVIGFIGTVLVTTAIACGLPEVSLQRLIEARALAADLSIQFTKAADAANRAVMADTDGASVAFATEAAQATDGVQKDLDQLEAILQSLGYSNETRLVAEFRTRFSEYRALDKTILGLAVENTNLKAQRLSFGPSQEAAEALRKALDAVVPPGENEESWRIRALVAIAVSAVRQVQVLQAPHIAEADDSAMTRLEQAMATSEAAAQSAVERLSLIVQPAQRPQMTAVADALKRFMVVNDEIVTLSRRNTNVRSLAMSLGQKRTLTAACEDTLRALQDALATRGFAGTR